MRKLTCFLACACVAVVGCLPVPDPPVSEPDGLPDEDTLHIFHNNRGAMCLEAVAWLGTMQVQYSDLEVQEHLTDDPDEQALLRQWRAQFDGSQGLSTSFRFLPIIFYRGQAFSGFNAQVAEDLAALIESAHTPGS